MLFDVASDRRWTLSVARRAPYSCPHMFLGRGGHLGLGTVLSSPKVVDTRHACIAMDTFYVSNALGQAAYIGVNALLRRILPGGWLSTDLRWPSGTRHADHDHPHVYPPSGSYLN